MATTTANNGWTIPQSTDLVSQGAVAIAALGNGIDTSTGKGLIAWQSWTPTVTNVTVGTGPTTSYTYAQLGKIVIVRLSLTLGTSGAVSGTPTFSLPVTASATANTNLTPGGIGYFNRGGVEYYGYVQLASTTTMAFYMFNAASTYLTNTAITSTIPFGTAWTAADRMRTQFIYEAA